MKRIDIYYGGSHYSVGQRDDDELRDEILAGLAAGPHWLEVNDGEGAPRRAYLLLSPGVPLAVIPIADEAPEVASVAAWGPGGEPISF
jgi:hypothetical protein